MERRWKTFEDGGLLWPCARRSSHDWGVGRRVSPSISYPKYDIKCWVTIFSGRLSSFLPRLLSQVPYLDDAKHWWKHTFSFFELRSTVAALSRQWIAFRLQSKSSLNVWHWLRENSQLSPAHASYFVCLMQFVSFMGANVMTRNILPSCIVG